MKAIKYLAVLLSMAVLCGCSALNEKTQVSNAEKVSKVPENSQSIKVYEQYVPAMTIPHAHDFLKGRADYEEEIKVSENEKITQDIKSDAGDGTVYLDDGIILDVPYINQRKDFPNGCESVSAVMALQYGALPIHRKRRIYGV